MELVVIEVTSIQPYIFASNRLREQVGASHLVAEATSSWIRHHVPSPHNVRRTGADVDDDLRIERQNLAAELIYSGGGNAVILFADKAKANAFLESFSRAVTNDAPGLQLNYGRCQCKEGMDGDLWHSVRQAFIRLAIEKRETMPYQPLLGQGVTRVCQSTGWPAVGFDPADPEHAVSADTLAKLEIRQDAERALSGAIPLPSGFTYPDELDRLGRTRGDFSHVAVIHIDGNDLGRRLQEVGRGQPARDYIQSVRKFSQRLANAVQSSLAATIERVIRAIDTEKGWLPRQSADEAPGPSIRLFWDSDHGYCLPVRPIVVGGDDITVVTDSRIALPFAVHFLKEFEERSRALEEPRDLLEIDEQGGTASAGICMVKSHYPFARAYQLAEELCASAKRFAKAQRDSPVSALDWHFAPVGLQGSIDEIRHREFGPSLEDPNSTLTLRPVTLRSESYEPERSWNVVNAGVADFQEPGHWPRNKLKRLMKALREGREAVTAFRTHYLEGKLLPDVGLNEVSMRETGWVGKHAGYFDALELVDWLIPL